LIIALLIPVIIGLFTPALLRMPLKSIVYCMALLMPAVVVFRAVYDWLYKDRRLVPSLLCYIHPLPAGIPVGTDLQKRTFPWATALLVGTNVLIFVLNSGTYSRAWVFLPHGDPAWPQSLASVFTSAFLHASPKHLLSNMVFMWCFGFALEPRIGSVRFLGLYFVCIALSKLFVVVAILWMNFHLGETRVALKDFHCLGASGAVSGLVGLFAVRCFFARIRITVPFLFLPFVSMPVRFNSLLLIGLYFALNVKGSLVQFVSGTRTNYLVHAGGYLAGVLIGYVMRLHVQAFKESLDVKALKLSRTPFRGKEAADQYAEILKHDERNPVALEYFLERYHAYDAARARAYFQRLLAVLIVDDFPAAVELFRAYYPAHMDALGGRELLRLGLHFYQNADIAKARRCLELASRQEGPWQARALFSLSLIYEALGSTDRARKIMAQVSRQFPDSPFQRAAVERLS
jgi:membrane associated rhomboid family serine protease